MNVKSHKQLNGTVFPFSLNKLFLCVNLFLKGALGQEDQSLIFIERLAVGDDETSLQQTGYLITAVLPPELRLSKAIDATNSPLCAMDYNLEPVLNAWSAFQKLGPPYLYEGSLDKVKESSSLTFSAWKSSLSKVLDVEAKPLDTRKLPKIKIPKINKGSKNAGSGNLLDNVSLDSFISETIEPKFSPEDLLSDIITECSKKSKAQSSLSYDSSSSDDSSSQSSDEDHGGLNDEPKHKPMEEEGVEAAQPVEVVEVSVQKKELIHDDRSAECKEPSSIAATFLVKERPVLSTKALENVASIWDKPTSEQTVAKKASTIVSRRARSTEDSGNVKKTERMPVVQVDIRSSILDEFLRVSRKGVEEKVDEELPLSYHKRPRLHNEEAKQPIDTQEAPKKPPIAQQSTGFLQDLNRQIIHGRKKKDPALEKMEENAKRRAPPMRPLMILISELLLEEDDIIVTLQRDFSISCMDVPAKEPFYVLLDEHSCCSILPLSAESDPKELKTHVKTIADAALYYSTIWVLILLDSEECEVPEKHLLQLQQAVVNMPHLILVRLCFSPEHLCATIRQAADHAFQLSSETGVPSSLANGGYWLEVVQLASIPPMHVDFLERCGINRYSGYLMLHTMDLKLLLGTQDYDQLCKLFPTISPDTLKSFMLLIQQSPPSLPSPSYQMQQRHSTSMDHTKTSARSSSLDKKGGRRREAVLGPEVDAQEVMIVDTPPKNTRPRTSDTSSRKRAYPSPSSYSSEGSTGSRAPIEDEEEMRRLRARKLGLQKPSGDSQSKLVWYAN